MELFTDGQEQKDAEKDQNYRKAQGISERQGKAD
jgi:hypothetical protein